jgi:excisionase family DNA binding protein
METETVLPRLLTIKEVHEQTGVPVRTLYAAIERGELPKRAMAAKRNWRLTAEDVQSWIASKSSTTTPKATPAAEQFDPSQLQAIRDRVNRSLSRRHR